jgi:hypothetical protein
VLSQKAMAALFDCSTDNVSLGLKNIFVSNELEENSVTEVFSATTVNKFLSFNDYMLMEGKGK